MQPFFWEGLLGVRLTVRRAEACRLQDAASVVYVFLRDGEAKAVKLRLRVTAEGRLMFQERCCRCALGRAGVGAAKREGDGLTPLGLYRLRQVFYRPDRIVLPPLRLPQSRLRPEDGWCDDAVHPAYNRPVRLPFAAGAERMWRNDRLYDVVVVLGHNDAPPRPGAGSAVFFHIAAEDYAPTAGCVAVALPDMLEILAAAAPETWMEIGVGQGRSAAAG